MATGDEIEAGHNTGANDTTRLVGEQTDPPLTDFNGDEIFEVVPLADSSRSPTHALDGIVAMGWNGTAAASFGTTGRAVAAGVIGKGGANEGPRVVGRGSDLQSGGTGVHGIGGPLQRTPAHPQSFPGVGVIGQGGRADVKNPERLFHGAGVVGVAGGRGLDPALERPLPSHESTASVGVFGLGGSAETVQIPDGAGGMVAAGAPRPGPGVVGQGGVPDAATNVPAGAGVVGVGGDVVPPPFKPGDPLLPPVPMPWIEPAAAVGVWGEGKAHEGVHGKSAGNRGGVFESDRLAQLRLVPRRMDVPVPTPFAPTAIHPNPRERDQVPLPGRGELGDLLTTVNADRICTLWLCVALGKDGNAKWAQVLLGPVHDGIA